MIRFDKNFTKAPKDKTMFLPDGLYQVTKYQICAGFVVLNGKVTKCAPVLQNKLSYWMTIAKRISI
jgi:hypothetical protein